MSRHFSTLNFLMLLLGVVLVRVPPAEIIDLLILGLDWLVIALLLCPAIALYYSQAQLSLQTALLLNIPTVFVLVAKWCPEQDAAGMISH